MPALTLPPVVAEVAIPTPVWCSALVSTPVPRSRRVSLRSVDFDGLAGPVYSLVEVVPQHQTLAPLLAPLEGRGAVLGVAALKLDAIQVLRSARWQARGLRQRRRRRCGSSWGK